MTNEDRDIVRTSVILPMILQMMAKDMQELEQSKQTFKPLFIKSVELMRDKVNTDLLAARRELSKRGIRVIEEDTDPRISKRWRIIQRGNEEVMEILRPTIRSDIAERNAAYNEGLFKDVKPGPLESKMNELGSRITRDGVLHQSGFDTR